MAKAIRSFKGIMPVVAETAYVDEAAAVIGDVVIGADSSVWPMTAIRGDVNKIRIGERTNIQDGSVLHVTRPGPLAPDGYALTIGDDVTVTVFDNTIAKCREYQSKWYADLPTCMKVHVNQAGAEPEPATSAPDAPVEDEDDLPFSRG